MSSLIIKDLNFSYGQKKVLKDINLEIGNGLFGLLGRNGAGKSTLMKLIVGLIPPVSGRIEVCGQTSVKEIRKKIGYLPQDFDFYPDMKVKESLFYLGTLDNITKKALKERVEILLELVNLKQESNVKIKTLSGGMKRRLGIAQSLLNDPEVLIVDEPTSGLDPEERIRFRNLLSDISKEKIVLFSTHIASDLESAAHGLGILENGNFIYHGTVDDLLNRYSFGTYETYITDNEYSDFKKKHIIFEQKEQRGGMQIRFIHLGKPQPDFMRIAPTLESAYLMCIHDRRQA
ncbi:MAG: ABC transporter ATP-binding protein [Gallicola sp.]|nr:ABC transporter ATP-binding protein [Gallicola sp.]